MGIGLLVIVISLGGKYSETHQLTFFTRPAFAEVSSAAALQPEADDDPPAAEATPAPEPPPPILVSLGPPRDGSVTHYGVAFEGQVLGCGTGYYTSDNPQIAAVSPVHYGDWPCGTVIHICGPAGCLDSVRHDACPGCGPNQIDLSEAGIAIVCGDDASVCPVELQPFAVEAPGPPDDDPP